MDEPSIGGVPGVRPRGTQGFWRRQFDDAPTNAQRVFDAAFGIVMPVVCFALDPIVFRDEYMYEGGLLGSYQFYAYALSAVEMVALCAWLLAAGGSGGRPAALAGMLLAGAAFSLAVGTAILPFSVIGLLFYLVGLLGFVPFVTAFVYLRNGLRAAGAADRSGAGRARLSAALACGFLLALGAPVVVRMSVEGEVAAALAGAHAEVTAGGDIAWLLLRVLLD